MAKLIIYMGGKPLIYGYKRHEFIWSEKHKCFIFENREFDEKDFNAVIQKAMTMRPNFHPYVKIVEFSETATVAEPPPPAPPAPRSDPHARRAITVEEAVMVLDQLAPDLLKKKSGRKPTPTTSLEVT